MSRRFPKIEKMKVLRLESEMKKIREKNGQNVYTLTIVSYNKVMVCTQGALKQRVVLGGDLDES